MANHETITLFTVRDKQWNYRAEGNGNLVISLENIGKVLRLVKTEDVKSEVGAHVVPSQIHEDTWNLHELVYFIDNTVAPLLGREFVHSGEIVRIAADELLWLSDELRPLRPESRLHKALASKDSLALLQPDHCSLPKPSANLIAKGLRLSGSIITVEIKPKMGFLSTRSNAHPDCDDIPICKYHLMQLWKVKQGKISEVSAYCPLDLFSGCRIRMTNSLHQLLRKPQNNLRIFKDGTLVYGESMESQLDDVLTQVFLDVTDLHLALGRLCRLIVDALLFDHNIDNDDACLTCQRTYSPELVCQCQTYNGNPFEDGTIDSASTCECICLNKCGGLTSRECVDCILPDRCILSRLLAVQMLNTSDARSLKSAYCRLQSKLKDLPTEVTKNLIYGMPTSLSYVPCLEDDDVRQIRHYLLSCTARDCSIMLKLCQLENEFDLATRSLLPADQFIITDANQEVMQTSFLCSLAFVDLDWKPLSRIPQHAELENALYDHWNSRRRDVTAI